MATKIRLARHGSNKRPFYHIVVADSRAPRDGRYIERVGHYNPMLPSDHAERVVIKEDRLKHWLAVGAEPTDRVTLFCERAGLIAASKPTVKPKQSLPKKKAQERAAAEVAAKEKAEAARVAAIEAEKAAKIEAEEAAKAAAAAPAVEEAAPAVEEVATTAEETPAAEAPAAEEAAAPAEEAPATEEAAN